jgi:phosphoglycolate phosphatase
VSETPNGSLYVLWDVDGTLLLNGVNAGGLYGEAIELAVGHPLDHPVPRVHGKTDGQILWEALEENELSPELHPVASAHLDALSLERHLGGSRREIAPGIVEAVTAVGERGFVNALLTGNSENRTRYKMEGAGLDSGLFDWGHSYFGDVSPTRSEITQRAARGLAAHRVVIIGDTPNGHYSVGELSQTTAMLAVPDLAAGFDQVIDVLDVLARQSNGSVSAIGPDSASKYRRM